MANWILGNRYIDGVFNSSDNYLNVLALNLEAPHDGWVTSANVHAAGKPGTQSAGALAIWGGTGKLLVSSVFTPWGDLRLWRSVEGFALRRPKGSTIRVGAMNEGYKPASYSADKGSGPTKVRSNAGSTLPDPFGNHLNMTDVLIAAYVDFTPNNAPSKPTWQADTAQGETTDPNPVFQGVVHHDKGDGAYDFTTQMRFRVVRNDTGRVVFDKTINTKNYKDNTKWRGRMGLGDALPPGVPCTAKYAHFDSWGVRSVWSDDLPITYIAGPKPPDIVNPEGKQNIRTLTITGTYESPDLRAMSAVLIQVYDATRKTWLTGTGWKTDFTDHSGDATVPYDWSYNLSWYEHEWGTGYNVRAKVRDTGGVESTFSRFQSYRINAAPSPPAKLSPANDTVTPRGILKARVSDPDGDPVTSFNVRVYNAATGALLLGYPKQGTIDGAEASFDANADLVLGTDYTWEASAGDGVLTSEWSYQASWRHDVAPESSFTAPFESEVVNILTEPSPEYADPTVGTKWSLGGSATGQALTVVNDFDAAFGEKAWEIAKPSGDFETILVGETLPYAGASASHAFSINLKSDDIASVSLELEALDSAGASLGYVSPATRSLTDSWTPNIAPFSAALPLGTASIRPIVRVPATAVGTLRADAAMVNELPAGFPFASFDDVKWWLGYLDASTTGYGGSHEDSAAYGWTGTAGASSSSGPQILYGPRPSLVFTYSQASGVAKGADRLIIQHLGPNGFEGVYDSGWVAGTRTSMPLPAGVVRNEGEYRLRVEVRDANGAVGSTGWAQFNARYEGPKELPILVVSEDPAKAEVVITHQRTTLTAEEFAGYEYRVRVDGERDHYFFQTNPDADTFVYPYPRSGVRHIVGVRQVENVGLDMVEGRWEEAITTLDYFPYFFLKDTRDPEGSIVRWEPLRGEVAAFGRDTPATWSRARGRKKPTRFIGSAEEENGSLIVSLWNDPEINESSEERLGLLEQMFATPDEGGEDVGAICLLSHLPSRKHFFSPDGAVTYDVDDQLDPVVTIPWRATHYPEDYRDRGDL